MKKTFISVSILFFASFMAFGQSITLTPTNPNQVSIRGYGSQRPTFSGFNNSGSLDAPSATGTGRMLVGVYGYGYTGSSFTSEPNASIELRASNGYTLTSTGSQIFFRTTSDGSTTTFDRMIITDIGRVGIGTLLPSSILEVKTPTDSYGIQHTDGTVTFGSYVSTTFGAYLGTRSNHPLRFFVNSGSTKLQIETGGNVVVTDYTKLGGASAPAIKQKLITGFITQFSEGFTTSIPHGLTPAKILNVSIFVEATNGFTGLLNQVPPNYIATAEMLYSYVVEPSNVEVTLSNTDSGSLLAKPIRVLITYME